MAYVLFGLHNYLWIFPIFKGMKCREFRTRRDNKDNHIFMYIVFAAMIVVMMFAGTFC